MPVSLADNDTDSTPDGTSTTEAKRVVRIVMPPGVEAEGTGVVRARPTGRPFIETSTVAMSSADWISPATRAKPDRTNGSWWKCPVGSPEGWAALSTRQTALPMWCTGPSCAGRLPRRLGSRSAWAETITSSPS